MAKQNDRRERLEKRRRVMRQRVERIDWFEYLSPAGCLSVDRRLLAALAPLLSGRGVPELDVSGELLGQYRQGQAHAGKPRTDPAMFEMFLGPARVPVYFVTTAGKVYAAAEPLFSFKL